MAKKPTGPQYSDPLSQWLNASWTMDKVATPSTQPTMGGYQHPPTYTDYMVNPATGQRLIKSQWDQMNGQYLEQKRIADMAAQGLNPDGSPVRPEYDSWLDEKTKMLDSTHQMNPELMDVSKLEGYGAVRDLAMRDPNTQSKWAQMMLAKQGAEQAQAKDAAARQSASSLATARSSLASRGGMTSGARERLAMQGGRDLLNARQDVNRAGIGQRLDILTQDESNRLALLPQFAQAEVSLQGKNLDSKNAAQKWNIEQALLEKQRANEQAMASYSEQQKKWAAEREAQATEKAAKDSAGGCWICTKVNAIHPLSLVEKEALFELKKYVLKEKRHIGRFYLRDCKVLVDKMSEAGANWAEWIGFEKAVVALVLSGHFEAAYSMYRNVVLDEISKYWPECESKSFFAARDERDNERPSLPNHEPSDMTAEDNALLTPVL